MQSNIIFLLFLFFFFFLSEEFREQKFVRTKVKSLTYSSGTEAGKAGLGPRKVSSNTDIRWKAKPPPYFALNQTMIHGGTALAQKLCNCEQEPLTKKTVEHTQ